MIDVLFSDRHLMVVHKPARMLTAADGSADDTLFALTKQQYQMGLLPGKKGYFAPLHFLDRPVSGAVMFALSSKAAQRMSLAMQKGQIQKTYLAVVEGHPEPLEGILHDCLVKDKSENFVRVAQPGEPLAKACTLHFRVLKRRGDFSLLQIEPKTGRSHQIRVQLASRGWPIFGDRKYGAAQRAEAPWEGRIALHALKVNFSHPVGGESVLVKAPLPPLWEQIFPGATDV